MKRFINQINVSLTTNRTCTLRCDHCYIAPHLFDDRSQMTTETFRSIFDQVERLYDLDARLEEIEWEAIGGETTMMPFEWWEENLPWALSRIREINKKIGKSGALNFLTNLVYSDKRYTDLINQYANVPEFCLYTSWEPDTGRFGKNNKLFPKFLKTLESIKAEQKILDVILTREVIKLGPEYLVETFVPRGITDFSIKMLSPYGSGKKFFEENMIDFNSMSEYLLKLGKIKPEHVTYTPQEEMLGSLHAGTSFQCNGNFLYDLAIEPDGNCTFNANQTADEASLGSRTIHISDPQWANKVMYENTKEANNKLSFDHPICGECEYMRFCNAGWYHYKIHDPKVIRLFDVDECSGYKKMWKEQEKFIGEYAYNVSDGLHEGALLRRGKNQLLPQEQAFQFAERHLESSFTKNYDGYFESCASFPKDAALVLDIKRKYSKSVDERLWFYESHGIQTIIEDEGFLSESIVRHWFYRNLTTLHIEVSLIEKWLSHNKYTTIAKRFFSMVAYLSGCGESREGVSIDSRHEEMLRTILDMRMVETISISPNDNFSEFVYINTLNVRRNIEHSYGASAAS